MSQLCLEHHETQDQFKNEQAENNSKSRQTNEKRERLFRPKNEMLSEARKFFHRNYFIELFFHRSQLSSHTPSALNAGAKRLATTSPAAAFDEGQPGVARSAAEGRAIYPVFSILADIKLIVTELIGPQIYFPNKNFISASMSVLSHLCVF